MASNVSPESLLTLMQHTPNPDTVLMFLWSSSKNIISLYGTPVTAMISCWGARGAIFCFAELHMRFTLTTDARLRTDIEKSSFRRDVMSASTVLSASMSASRYFTVVYCTVV